LFHINSQFFNEIFSSNIICIKEIDIVTFTCENQNYLKQTTTNETNVYINFIKNFIRVIRNIYLIIVDQKQKIFKRN
jgi:hypothetical protein